MTSRFAKWWTCGVVSAALLGTACGSSDKAPAQAVPSQLNQSCEKTADCVAGLACVNQVCTSSTRLLTPNDNECAVVECNVPADCCGSFVAPAICPTYKADCALDPTLYSAECSLYATECVCDPTPYTCDNGTCTQHLVCTIDTDCFGGRCVSGNCVACVTEADCADVTKTCSQNLCVPKCVDAGECRAFEDCQGGVCVHVGCKTDRECLVSHDGSDPGLGFCDTTRTPTPECAFHCGTDVDCPNLDPITSTAQVCVGGRCVSAGCVDADECKVLLGNPLLNGTTHIECRAHAN